MTTDRTIWRKDLQRMLGKSSETMRRWINSGTLPKPDVQLSRSTLGWKASTLQAAGVDLAELSIEPVCPGLQH